MVCQQKSFKIIVLIMALFTIFSFDSFHSVVQAQSMTYTVQPGDTLSAIAVRFGTSMQEIAAANGIQNINAIRVGQALLVPSGITSGSTPSNPTITAPVISSAQVQVPYAPVTSQTYVPAAPIQGRSAQSAEEPSR